MLINGVEALALVDTGATHNFVAEREIERLKLKITSSKSKIKAVNSEARPSRGQAKVDLLVGP